MSLMKSLARVAAGVLVAKGLSKVMQNRAADRPAGTATRRTGGGLLDEITRSVQGTRQTGAGTGTGAASGGFGDILGRVLGGGNGAARAGTGQSYGESNRSGASGGIGGLFDQLTNATQARHPRDSGGLGDLVGGMLGGGAAGTLATRGAQASNDSSFGELLNDSLSRGDEPATAPTAEQNAVAGLLLRAMIQAAKADGRIDEGEKERLTAELGDDLDEEERAFIREQMAMPVDAAALARDVPQGLEPQVYLMSVMAIDFDSQEEAQYLHQLAQALGLDAQVVNGIHQQIGVQNLYA